MGSKDLYAVMFLPRLAPVKVPMGKFPRRPSGVVTTLGGGLAPQTSLRAFGNFPVPFNQIKATNIKVITTTRELTLIIITHYMPELIDDYKSKIIFFFQNLELLAGSRGLPFVIKYVKESRNSVMNFLSGTPLKAGVLVALDNDGWPKWLYIFKDCANSPEHLKLLMTLLVSLR